MIPCSAVCRGFWRYKNQLVLCLTPLVLLPLPLTVHAEYTPEALCGYVMILMGVYWCTEAMPIPATACIPIFIFPLMGLLDLKDVCNQYLNHTMMMLMGSLMVAIAVEKSNVHKRISLRIIMSVGTKPQWLMAGFMFPTWFLSMWISNTATTAMMLPIMEAVLNHLEGNKDNDDTEEMTEASAQESPSAMQKTNRHYDNHAYIDDVIDVNEKLSQIGNSKQMEIPVDMENNHDETPHQMEQKGIGEKCPETGRPHDKKATDQDFSHVAKGMTLCVAYAANCGGTATLTGTPPNVIMKDAADNYWAAQGLGESPVNFASWMVFGVPVATNNLLLTWSWLVLYYVGIRSACGCCKCCKTRPADDILAKKRERAIQRYLREQYDALGSVRFAEGAVVFSFVVMVLLWFFRSPQFLPGWADQPVFKSSYLGDAVVSMAIVVLLFVIPNKLPGRSDPDVPVDTLLDWNIVQQRFPWGIVFLIGGGFSLAKASVESGLSLWIGTQLEAFQSWPGWAMVAFITLLIAMLTEVTSNSATCAVFMPIVATLAVNLNKNPLYLMLPVAVSTSFAFMLPVATPPNALAFTYGRIRILDMVKGGAILNFLCVFSVTLATHTWGMRFFDLDTLPWDPSANGTTTALP